MEVDVPSDPVDIGLFCPLAVILVTYATVDLVEQRGRFGWERCAGKMAVHGSCLLFLVI